MNIIIRSHVRGGGYGRSAWVAKINGLCEQWGFEREFLDYEDGTSGSGKSGVLIWEITEPGIYQIAKLQKPKGEAAIGRLYDAFVLINEDGEMRELTKKQVRDLMG